MSDWRVSARQAGYSRPKCADARGATAAAKRRVAETILSVLLRLTDCGLRCWKKEEWSDLAQDLTGDDVSFKDRERSREMVVTSPDILDELFVVSLSSTVQLLDPVGGRLDG